MERTDQEEFERLTLGELRKSPADQHGPFDDAGDEQHMAENGCAGPSMPDTRGISLDGNGAPQHHQQVGEYDLPKSLLPGWRLRRQREKRSEHTSNIRSESGG